MDWWCWLLPVLARTRTGGRRCSSEPIVARRGSRAAVLNAGSKAGPHGHCRETQMCRQDRRQQLRHQSILPTAADRLRNWPSPKPSRLTGGGVWSEDRRGACTSGKDRADCTVSSGGAQNTVSGRLAGIRPVAQKALPSAMRLPGRMVEAPSPRRPRGYNSSGANVSCDASRCAAKPGGCNYLMYR